MGTLLDAEYHDYIDAGIMPAIVFEWTDWQDLRESQINVFYAMYERPRLRYPTSVEKEFRIHLVPPLSLMMRKKRN